MSCKIFNIDLSPSHFSVTRTEFQKQEETIKLTFPFMVPNGQNQISIPCEWDEWGSFHFQVEDSRPLILRLTSSVTRLWQESSLLCGSASRYTRHL